MPAFNTFMPPCRQQLGIAALTLAALGLSANSAMAGGKTAKADACQDVIFSDLGDSALVAKTSAAAVVLQALGYKPESFRLTSAETVEALQAGKIDIFLGADLRVPSEAETTKKRPKPKPDAGPIENLSVNQPFPMGPPSTVASVPEGDNEADKGNEELSGAEKKKSPQEAQKNGFVSQARSGFSADCPNVAKFIKNLTYSADMIWFIETQVTEEFEEPFDAAVNWFADHPQVLAQWLDGVVSFRGENALEKVNTEFAF